MTQPKLLKIITRFTVQISKNLEIYLLNKDWEVVNTFIPIRIMYQLTSKKTSNLKNKKIPIIASAILKCKRYLI